MGTGDSGEVTARPELDRRQAMSLVSDALTTVIPGLPVEALDERQELYADLGLDSLGLARLLIELEGKLGVQLVDEYLMTIELVTVADLVALVERSRASGGKVSLSARPRDDLLPGHELAARRLADRLSAGPRGAPRARRRRAGG